MSPPFGSHVIVKDVSSWPFKNLITSPSTIGKKPGRSNTASSAMYSRKAFFIPFFSLAAEKALSVLTISCNCCSAAAVFSDLSVLLNSQRHETKNTTNIATNDNFFMRARYKKQGEGFQ